LHRLLAFATVLTFLKTTTLHPLRRSPDNACPRSSFSQSTPVHVFSSTARPHQPRPSSGHETPFLG
jgi:hypothetical protein